MDGANLELADGTTLRLRERLAPRRPSSNIICGAIAPTIGEYGRGVGGEKEETCNSMTYSCVAFVSFTILVRRVEDNGCVDPCAFIAFKS